MASGPFTRGAVPGTRRSLWAGLLIVVAISTTLIAALGLAPVGSAVGNGSSNLIPADPIPPWNNWTCNPNDLSPAALYISLPNIAHTEPRGSVLTAHLAYRVPSFVPADRNKALHMPLVDAVFPLTNGSKVTIVIPAKTFVLNGQNWSPPSVLDVSKTLTSNTTFSSTPAYLTSLRWAVMVNRTSGSVTVEFMWHWRLVPAGGGAPISAKWSVPSKNATYPEYPTIFYPAPFVGVLSSSRSPALAGSQFNLTIDGYVASTSFRMVIEFPSNNTEIHSIWENSSKSISKFNVSDPLTYRNGKPLSAGTYLIHIHDVCEAIVYIRYVIVSSTPAPGLVPGQPGLLRPLTD